MAKKIFWIAAAILLTGCTGVETVPADMQKLESSKPGSIVVSNREKPSFQASTAGKAAVGGLIGAAMMMSAGNEIVRENSVEDPAGYIGAEMAKTLAEKLSIQTINSSSAIAKKTDPAALSEQYTGSDILVDVETERWGFAYFPDDWDNYRVLYHAKIKIVDIRSRSTLGEASCAIFPSTKENSPSYDELLANQAERLKKELRIAADNCIGELRAKVLQL